MRKLYFNFNYNMMLQQINDNLVSIKNDSNIFKELPSNYKKNIIKKNLFLLYLVIIRLITLDITIAKSPGEEILINWYSTNFSAVDIGVGSKGDLFTIGIDKNLYLYEFKSNEFIKIDKDHSVKDKEFTRVDVDDNGNPYVITSDSQIYTYNYIGKWINLPGCAKDIGIGKNNNLWKIGCNEQIGGYGVWSLFCVNSPENKKKDILSSKNQGVPFFINNEKNNNNNKYHGYNNKKYIHKTQENKHIFDLYSIRGYGDDSSDCFWIRSETSGIRIDVGQNGDPVITDREGNLKIFKQNSKKTFIIHGIKVRDTTVSNDGMIFVTDFNDFNIYKLEFKFKENELEDFFLKFDDNKIHYINQDAYTWIKLSGKGTSISAGPYSQPFVINREGLLLSSSKFGFN